MRLINVKTLEFHEFFGSQLGSVQYGILSHTWGDEEVSYQEMRDSGDAVQAKKGYAKITNAAKQAKTDGLNWVWVDRCCIDKSSSAELTGAINSMYKWYERSTVCYAYLEDVQTDPEVKDKGIYGQVIDSRWFTRGWTLQELIAPEKVIFYTWDRIADKISGARPSNSVQETTAWDYEENSWVMLCDASDVPYELLFGKSRKESYSVAQRMSWASKRVCTRIEDTAYCLLGLFDINMPLLYGEEERAFVRLQEEIIRTTDDHSNYAWTIPPDYYTHHPTYVPNMGLNYVAWSCHPVLADSPSLFAACGNIVAFGREHGQLSTMTKHGLRIETWLKECLFPVQEHFFKAYRREVLSDDTQLPRYQTRHVPRGGEDRRRPDRDLAPRYRLWILR